MRRRDWSLMAFVAVAALIPFLPALHAGFLDWDDRANLLFNAAYRGFSPQHLRWMLATHHRGPWQPLSWLSYALDYACWGLDAPAFRRTNLLLHAVAAGLLVPVAKRLLGKVFPEPASVWGALAAALFFALHPLRVESVVWLTERRDVLSGALLLAAWWARLEGRDRLGLGLFAGALLAKGTAVALPFFLLAAEFWPEQRLPPDPRGWRTLQARAVWAGLAPYFALAATAGMLNLAGLRTGDLGVPALGLGARLLLAAHSAGFYLLKTLWPAGLSPYYPLPKDWAAAVPGLAWPVVAAVAATAAAWNWRRRAPWALPVWLAYLAALAPLSGLLQAGAQLAADRYSYLPGLPFALVVGGLAATLAGRSARGAVALAAAGAMALGASSWAQSLCWRDDVALWTRAVDLAPDAYLPRSNLAQALLAAGDAAGALEQYPEVLRLEPRDVEARVNLGVLLEQRGQTDQAERLFREALALRPTDSQAAADLAGLLAQRGERTTALALLQDLVARRPDFAPGRHNLGVLLMSMGRRSEGLAQMRAAGYAASMVPAPRTSSSR